MEIRRTGEMKRYSMTFILLVVLISNMVAVISTLIFCCIVPNNTRSQELLSAKPSASPSLVIYENSEDPLQCVEGINFYLLSNGQRIGFISVSSSGDASLMLQSKHLHLEEFRDVMSAFKFAIQMLISDGIEYDWKMDFKEYQ